MQAITHMYSLYNMKDRLIGIRIKESLLPVPKKDLFAVDASFLLHKNFSTYPGAESMAENFRNLCMHDFGSGSGDRTPTMG